MRIKHVVVIALVVALLSAAVTYAATMGSLDSPAAPGATSSYTLQDIWNRLNAGTAGAQSTFTEPAAGPGTATMHTLNEIMGIAPVADNSNGATAAQVLTGKTYWSLRTDGSGWGQKTGTAVAGSDVNGADGFKSFNIPDGFYSGKTATAIDSDLLAGNIRCGVTIFGVSGAILPECVKKTGQTSCWDSDGYPILCTGTGQDGAYQKGCLPVVAPSGGGSFAGYNRTSFTCSGGFTDNGNGTVTDNLTGLIWLKNANCFGKKDWAGALSAANALANGTCGLSDGSSAGDWRLPNLNELRSLFDPSRLAPYLPASHPFTGVQSSLYWTSTSYAGKPSLVWRLYLGDGSVSYNVKWYPIYVWPVRGGQ